MVSPKLAFAAAILFLLLLLLGYVGAEGPDRFRVGDAKGWRVPAPNDTSFYNTWASRIRFRVGDSIYFEYTEDSVVAVDKRGYYHCNATDPIHVYKDGATSVVLDKPGPFYFISGDVIHCKRGQRLIVDVMAKHTPTQPPSLPSVPPSSSVVPSTGPSPSTNSADRSEPLWVGATMAVVAPVLLGVGL